MAKWLEIISLFQGGILERVVLRTTNSKLKIYTFQLIA